MARTLRPLRMAFQSPSSRRSFASSVFDKNLLRILNNELTYLSDYRTPLPPPRTFGSFTVEDRPGQQWIRLRSEHAAGREDVKIDATMFDGAAPIPPSKKAVYEGEVRLHISLVVEVSKGEGSDSVLEFVCSAWPDSLQVQRVFPFGRRAAVLQPYLGRDFKKLGEEVQNSVLDYLEERGVHDELAEFLHEYMANKDKIEILRWLKRVECYIQK